MAEIFRACTAFIKLSEMKMLLHPMGDTHTGGKWTDEEIEMLRSCGHRFSVHFNKLSRQHMKSRTVWRLPRTRLDVEGLNNDVNLEFNTLNGKVST